MCPSSAKKCFLSSASLPQAKNANGTQEFHVCPVTSPPQKNLLQTPLPHRLLLEVNTACTCGQTSFIILYTL